MDSKGLKLPVSGSDKMEASVLGCRLSEKAEHLPIKKRRFLFMDSSPPHNTNGTESVVACLQSSVQDVHPKPDDNCPSAASLKVADLFQSESSDSKPDVKKLIMYSKKTVEKEDIGTTSVTPGTLELKAKNVKLENISAKETDFSIPTAPVKDVASSLVANSTLNESTLDSSCPRAHSESECTKRDQVIGNTQQSAALDDRLSWDLNTVMAWEEQQECESGHYKQGKECGSVSENIQNETAPNKLKSLIPKVERSELEECKPVGKLLSPVVNIDHLAVINKIRSLHNQPAESCIPDAVSSALTLENPVSKISANLAGVMAAGTGFTFMPSGFGNGMSIRENAVSSKTVGSGSDVNNHTLASVQRTENDKLNLSLVTASSLEDDKANVKRLITSNSVAMENMVYRGAECSRNVLISSKSVVSGNNVNHAVPAVQTIENEKLNLSLVTSASTDVVAHQRGSMFDGEDDKSKVKKEITSKGITMENPPAAVSSMRTVEVPLQSGKPRTDIPNNIISNSKEACDNENFPSDIQAGSEVDNVDEVVSFSYEDSQFEDGEFRESSIQTWERNENRETEHGIENKDAFGTHENGSLKSTDVGSQKGTDESSSVLLPEKLDSSDQISSEPNVTENCTTEVNMKDASQSDQWKMNVSGSDLQPENHSSSSNITKVKDFSSIKLLSSRVTEDLETKGELPRLCRRESSTRDAFISRSRFRMQGSCSNPDDSASQSVRDPCVVRSARHGKYTRGGGTWDRSPPYPGSSFRRSLPEDDNLTDKVGLRVNPTVTRGSFRTRLTVNSEEDEFRARLGLRPVGETCHNRFANVGRGRSLRYGSRHNDVGPRDRYYGHPANDEPPMEYSHSFPTRRSFFHSGSTSPPSSRTRSPVGEGFRTRSRSPMRPDTRIRREPGYRQGFESDHVGGYNMEQSRNNNSPPSTRFLKYKRSFVFNRSPPPPSGERERERLGFYESSRKTKLNENYRSSRFSEIHGGVRDSDGMDHGYRRGGFARPYDMGRPVKHIQYEEDGYGPPVYDSRDKEDLEFHGRVNLKPYPRRAREDRDKR
ncbi:uncharacterized protein LOC143637705 [Bidens hawaiensis]|uniref:uncharacterized protein LOC143637705 n=1 Tax=Bidens hawaiensis TaxID=980011 RepID=UPI004049FB5E